MSEFVPTVTLSLTEYEKLKAAAQEAQDDIDELLAKIEAVCDLDEEQLNLKYTIIRQRKNPDYGRSPK